MAHICLGIGILVLAWGLAERSPRWPLTDERFWNEITDARVPGGGTFSELTKQHQELGALLGAATPAARPGQGQPSEDDGEPIKYLDPPDWDSLIELLKSENGAALYLDPLVRKTLVLRWKAFEGSDASEVFLGQAKLRQDTLDAYVTRFQEIEDIITPYINDQEKVADLQPVWELAWGWYVLVFSMFFVGFYCALLANTNRFFSFLKTSLSSLSSDDEPQSPGLQAHRNGESQGKQDVTVLSPQAVSKSGEPEKPLMATNVGELHKTLAEKGPVRRAMQRKKSESVAKQTKDVVDADTELIKAQADQIKTVVGEQVEIEKLQAEGELLPLKQVEAISDSLAAIAENELRAAKAKRQIADLAEPPEEPKKIEAQEDPVEKVKRRWASELAASVDLQGLKEEFLQRAREKYKDNPEILRIYEDKLDQLFEEQLEK